MDFTNYKFRCSALGYLMTDPRSKSEAISETTKAYLTKVFVSEVYGRDYDATNRYCEKGLFVEELSLNLAKETLLKGTLPIKNKERFWNDFIQGTPDLVLDTEVVDIKSSWDLLTFANADGSNKNYYWQLQGYMWLTGKVKARLMYCLINTPEHLLVGEKIKAMRATGFTPEMTEYVELEEKIEHLYTFDDIEKDKRIKAFDFEANLEDIEKLAHRIVDCRAYLNTLSL